MVSALGMSFAERTVYSGQMFFIGMATVFTVLALLWLAVEMFHRAVSGPGEKKESGAVLPAVEAAPLSEAVCAPADVPVAPPVAQNNDELIAVLTAAVAATLASEGESGTVKGFRVVSFRRL